MEKLEYILRFLVPDAMMALLLLDFCARMYGRKYKANWVYIVAFLVFVVVCVAINQLFLSILNIAYSYIAFILLSVLLYCPSRRKIFCDIFFMTYCTIIDFVCVYGMLAISEEAELSAMMQNARMVWYNLLSKMIIYFSYRLVLEWMNHVPNRPLSPKHNIFLAVISVGELGIVLYFSELVDTTTTAAIVSAMSLGFLALNLYIVHQTEAIVKAKETELQLQLYRQQENIIAANYREMESRYEQSRRIIHDIRNQLHTLEQMDDTSQKGVYVAKIKENVEMLGVPKVCPSPLLNILFNDKKKLAASYKILLHLNLRPFTLDNYDEMDLLTIFANLIDNAIDACKPLPQNQRKIELRIHSYGGKIISSIENRYQGNCPKDPTQSFCTSKKDHMGIGLSNVREIVNRYDGELEIHTENQTFIVRLILYPGKSLCNTASYKL